MQPPVFGSPSATSGRTTPTWAGAGSRSQILGRGHRQRGQTLVRSLVVSQVGDIGQRMLVMGFLFQKTTSSLAVSLKMAVTALQRQQKVVEWLL